ncbi:nucleotidyltransferase domain-containing protein [Actinomadura parmotrematis]|uniref:Nucleotidyltransferase domain-containing protein n=1 Tax=Actinomadura parmotrematis TaxID=2864039 RepID=A0ABS7FRU9_9ACTN|nr:nucleotidyltransferase domain-containing protein [Actinomadura parmotrematis]MBW8482277.1 nucleotidyltransferase domain-containing protein [Actinomadura parmotrematis]
MDHSLVRDHTVLAVVAGSRAYGLATALSDTDRRGVYAAPAALFWRLDKPPAHIEGPLDEQFSWEIERFCELALKGNPTILECLWSPLVERVAPTGEELLAIRGAFLSRLVHRTFGGYADAQFRKIEQDLRNQGEIRWKHAMHMLRLLASGRHLLETGEPLVHVGDLSERLLAVRRGDVPWDEVAAWRADLTADLDKALATTPLPETPDRDRVQDLLISVRRRSLDA